MTGQAARTPSTNDTRLPGPDCVRGLGVLLLLLTNVALILTPIRYEMAIGENLMHGVFLNDLATALFLAIPPMSGMGMFVLTMGLGLSHAGESPSQFHTALRRLLIIGAIGLIHGLLIWWGDILFYYLAAGMIALYFRARPPLAQITVGLSIMFLPLILTMADLLARIAVSQSGPDEAADLTEKGYRALSIRAEYAYSSRDWLAIQEQRLDDWLSYFQDFALVGIPQLVGLLLVGIGLARLRSGSADLLHSRRVGVALRLILVAATLAYAFQVFVQVARPQAAGIASAVAACCQVSAPPLLAISLYVAVLRNESRLNGFRSAQFLAIVGRYTLTIYLGSSILCTLVAYGFGAYGQLSMSAAMGIAGVLFAILSGLCAVLHHCGIRGPLEVLVRAVAGLLGGRTRPHTESKGG
ncbi:hypothetical protein C5C24_04700 [Rathayibacter sp. AY2B3]|nr:hypothetical protein C5C24_04700 [Rathayibacter sp. AY2B3]